MTYCRACGKGGTLYWPRPFQDVVECQACGATEPRKYAVRSAGLRAADAERAAHEAYYKRHPEKLPQEEPAELEADSSETWKAPTEFGDPYEEEAYRKYDRYVDRENAGTTAWRKS